VSEELKLLPCPCCNAEARYFECSSKYLSVECAHCSLSTPGMSESENNRYQRIATLWNTRATDRRIAALEMVIREIQSLPSPDTLCSDCPPTNHPTDKTRCDPCPRRSPDGVTQNDGNRSASPDLSAFEALADEFGMSIEGTKLRAPPAPNGEGDRG
jgi:hypothetical protein